MKSLKVGKLKLSDPSHSKEKEREGKERKGGDLEYRKCVIPCTFWEG
jgi:hypothetical protein